MKTLRYEMIVRAEEPIAHFSETVDNEAIFMRKAVRQPGGGFVMLPEIQANTMRNRMREAAVYATLDAAGLTADILESDSVLRFLFSGGGLQKRGEGTKKSAGIKLDDYARLCDVFPPLALFGGTTNSRILPSKMQVGPARLLCAEQTLTEWAREWLTQSGEQLDSYRSHIEPVLNVHMDPALNPSKRMLLTTKARADVEARLLASETAHANDDAIEREKNKSDMMPYSFETVVRGSLFHWVVTATLDTELEEDTLLAVLGVFLSNAHVGGKRGQMYGHIVPVTAQQFTVSRPAERANAVELNALGGRVGSLFRAHVQERGEALREWLGKIAA